MDITKGNLDDISRPASNHHRSHHRPGSRVSLHTPSSAGSTRQSTDVNNSLEILPSESPILNQQEFDLELVELFSSGSDSECDDTSGPQDKNEGDKIPDKPNSNSSDDGHKSGCDEATKTSATSDPLDNIHDPKIREAMKKMQQLDRILAKKVIKLRLDGCEQTVSGANLARSVAKYDLLEKEVKRQRLKAHREMEKELETLKPEGREEQREVIDNTSRYLALVLPSSHSEGVSLDQEPVDPVFQTQPAESNTPVDGGRLNNTGRTEQSSKVEKGDGTERSSQVGGTKRAKHAGKQKGKGKGRDNTSEGGSDFIQRNIDLASDAGNMIAMTDDEKKRLEELLQDVEMLVENQDKSYGMRGVTTLQLTAGVGYIPDTADQQALQDIDAKLKALLPPEDFDRISTTPSQSIESNWWEVDPGEKVLKDTKNNRMQQERLRRIEDELEYLETQVETEICKSPRLSQENLSDLLEQCSELSSRAATEADSILQLSPRSGRPLSTVNENETQDVTPKLPDDVLQRLLTEARESCISDSTLSTLTPISSLDTQQMSTARSDGNSILSFGVMSKSTIKELLRNPRATSNAVVTTATIMDVAGRNENGLEEKDGIKLEIRGIMENGCSSDDLGSSQKANWEESPAAQSQDGSIGAGPNAVSPSTRQTWQLCHASASNTHSDGKGVSAEQSSITLSLDSFQAAPACLKSPETAPMMSHRNGISSECIVTPPPNKPRISAGSPVFSDSPKTLTSKYKSKLSTTESLESSPREQSSFRLSTESQRSKKAKPPAQLNLETRSKPLTPQSHTTSRASTNTLVSSSDFEYEEDEEITQQLLSDSPSAEIGLQRSSVDRDRGEANKAASSIEQNVLSITRYEQHGTEEKFSPPLI